MLDRLNPTIAELSAAIEGEVERCPEAQRLRTHPGVGSLTALAFVLIVGEAERFQCGKQIASYLGLVPSEESSGDRRRLGHITKQGNSLLRFLLVEAAQVTVRSDPEWRSKFFHLALRRGRKIAKVAMARRLAVRLYWMWRKGWDYEQMKKFGSHAGQPGSIAIGVLLHTMAMSGLSRVRTELFHLLVIPSLAPHPVQTNCESTGHGDLGNLPSPPQGQVEKLAAPLRVAAHCDLGCFHQQEAQQRVALFGDMSQPSSIPAGLL